MTNNTPPPDLGLYSLVVTTGTVQSSVLGGWKSTRNKLDYELSSSSESESYLIMIDGPGSNQRTSREIES